MNKREGINMKIGDSKKIKITTRILLSLIKICWIHMKLEEFDQRAAKLSPVGTEMESELELSMYRITEWELVYYDGK